MENARAQQVAALLRGAPAAATELPSDLMADDDTPNDVAVLARHASSAYVASVSESAAALVQVLASVCRKCGTHPPRICVQGAAKVAHQTHPTSERGRPLQVSPLQSLGGSACTVGTVVDRRHAG